MTISAGETRYTLSMETVYIDRLFFLNLLIDYFLLLCSGKVCGVPLRRGRYAAAAALGAAYAALTVLPAMGFLTQAPMKLALGVGMAAAAFGGEKRLLRCTVVFFAVSAAFGGAVWAVSMLAGTSYTGRLWLPVSFRTLAVSFAACYAAVSVVFRRSGHRAERELAALTLGLSGRTVALRALRDTGNALFDPVSGKAVIVAEAAALLPLFPADAASDLLSPDPAELVTRLSRQPGQAGRFRLVPYSAVGTASGLLAAFRPDYVETDGTRGHDCLVALCPTRLSEAGDYAAII